MKIAYLVAAVVLTILNFGFVDPRIEDSRKDYEVAVQAHVFMKTNRQTFVDTNTLELSLEAFQPEQAWKKVKMNVFLNGMLTVTALALLIEAFRPVRKA